MSNTLRVAARLCAALILGSLISANAAYPACEPLEFSMRLRFEETLVFTGAPPCLAVATLTARGWATHVGEVSASSQDCVNSKGAFDPGAPASNSFVFTNDAGPLRIAAANGDQIFIVYSGSLSAQADGPHRIRGHFVVTGGTGRFSHAIGGGTLTGHEDITQVVSGRGEVVAAGTIFY